MSISLEVGVKEPSEEKDLETTSARPRVKEELSIRSTAATILIL